jgi:hypothetical protein
VLILEIKIIMGVTEECEKKYKVAELKDKTLLNYQA